LKLYYLEECGFAPTLPTAYSWSLQGQRKRIDYESPQGRRVNAMAAYRPYGTSPRLEVFTAERTWDSCGFLGFLEALPRAAVPRVVVLDNAGLHTSHVVRQAQRGLSTCPPVSNPCVNRAKKVGLRYHFQVRASPSSSRSFFPCNFFGVKPIDSPMSMNARRLFRA